MSSWHDSVKPVVENTVIFGPPAGNLIAHLAGWAEAVNPILIALSLIVSIAWGMKRLFWRGRR